jgi:dTMP kinase
LARVESYNTAAQKRGGFGDERYETAELQRAVRTNFEALTEDWWTVVDAQGTMDEVAGTATEVAMAAVARCKLGEPFTRLWQ